MGMSNAPYLPLSAVPAAVFHRVRRTALSTAGSIP